jgi:hypothetical protein
LRFEFWRNPNTSHIAPELILLLPYCQIRIERRIHQMPPRTTLGAR